MELKEKAADFTLSGIDKDGNEIEFKLSDYLGRNVILFFYPKDEMASCTLEAVDFSNSFEYLDNIAKVVGISSDSCKQHKEFQKKYDLKLTLLSDPEKKVENLYGLVEATDLEHKKNIAATYLIDKDGKIFSIWKDSNLDGHVEEVLQELKKLG